MMYDIVIVGAGPGGSACAKEAQKLGLNVALINGGKIGGTCLNCGCMPTKAMYEFSKAGKGFFDTISHAREVVKVLGEKSSRLRDFPFDFFDKKVIEIKEGQVVLDDKKVLDTKFVVLATGSTPKLIKGVELDKLITNENFLDLEELPTKLAIVGGGYIGIEFANIFSKLGSKVEVFEFWDRILLTEDKECLKEVVKSLEDRGVKFNFNSKFEGGDFDKVLVSIGRSPNVSLVENLVELNDGVKVNSRMKSSVSWLFAVGDCVNLPYRLAHVAEEEGKVAARNISVLLEQKSEGDFIEEGICFLMDYRAIPTRVFCDPLISAIGKQERDLKEESYLIGRSWFKANGMPYCTGDLRGFVKVLIDKKNHELLGAVSVGNVDLHEVGLAIKEKINAEKIINFIYFHPSYQEILKEAVENALKE